MTFGRDIFTSNCFFINFCLTFSSRLSLLESAEMKRSALVERATTDEEEDLESWGDSDSETDEPETHDELPTVEEANREETVPKINEKVQEEKVEKVDEPKETSVLKDVSKTKKSVSEELKDAAKDEAGPEARQATQTPVSNPDSKESWTAVEKSESDDWEQEFDLEMTEEEIEKALKNEVSPRIPHKYLKIFFKKKDNTKSEKDDVEEDGELDDWSDNE